MRIVREIENNFLVTALQRLTTAFRVTYKIVEKGTNAYTSHLLNLQPRRVVRDECGC